MEQESSVAWASGRENPRGKMGKFGLLRNFRPAVLMSRQRCWAGTTSLSDSKAEVPGLFLGVTTPSIHVSCLDAARIRNFHAFRGVLGPPLVQGRAKGIIV